MLFSFVLFMFWKLYNLIVGYILPLAALLVFLLTAVRFISRLPGLRLCWPKDLNELYGMTTRCGRVLVESTNEGLRDFMWLTDKSLRILYYLLWDSKDVTPEEIERTEQDAGRKMTELHDLTSGNVSSQYKQALLDTLKDPNRNGLEMLLPRRFKSRESLRRAHAALFHAFACQHQDQSFSTVSRNVQDLYDHEGKVCVICHDQPAKHVYPNCGHLAVCSACRSLAGNRCPFCRCRSIGGPQPLLVA
eukprot:gb/GECG01004116.1/.p1 GENE.gb/GECG01004116.1/~~gb/GECG01004116.1/.p1  ORF type:complete len:247 (+),score=17.56 gb/GECG01004116.1/:1-741(+)